MNFSTSSREDERSASGQVRSISDIGNRKNAVVNGEYEL